MYQCFTPHLITKNIIWMCLKMGYTPDGSPEDYGVFSEKAHNPPATQSQ